MGSLIGPQFPAAGSRHTSLSPEESIQKPHDQRYCTLLGLPREVRDEIYRRLFRSTRLTFGRRASGRGKRMITKPKPHSLAIRWTCHQIHEETEIVWLNHVLFNFKDPLALMDKPSALPPSSIPHIRHLRVEEGPFRALDVFSYRAPRIYHYSNLASALQIFPTLRLDAMVVFEKDCCHLNSTSRMMIEQTSGWTHLYIVCPVTPIFGSWFLKHNASLPLCNLFRSHARWQRMFVERDGHHTAPSMSISYSTKPKVQGAILDSRYRHCFDTSLPFVSQMMSEHVSPTPQNRRIYLDREIMISAKRGDGVDVSRHVDPEFECDDKFSLKTLKPEEFNAILMSMGGAIRQQVLNNDGDEYDAFGPPLSVHDESIAVLRDEYDDVDEHHWPVKVWKNMMLLWAEAE